MKYNFENLYEHVGYLFYGLVCREGRISASDLLKLTEFVDRTWRPQAAGDPTLSMHLADCIQMGIRYGTVNRMSAAQALESFKGYFILHALGFSGTLRERILSSVHTIRKDFKGSSETEGIEDTLPRLFAVPPVTV
jgi:hypothetical protein